MTAALGHEPVDRRQNVELEIRAVPQPGADDSSIAEPSWIVSKAKGIQDAFLGVAHSRALNSSIFFRERGEGRRRRKRRRPGSFRRFRNLPCNYIASHFRDGAGRFFWVRVLVFPEVKHLNKLVFFDLVARDEPRFFELGQKRIAIQVIKRENLGLNLPVSIF